MDALTLIGATQEANADMVRDLLEGGAAVNDADADGRTALSHAAECGILGITIMLLRAGADPNLVDNDGRSPVFWIAQRKKVQPI